MRDLLRDLFPSSAAADFFCTPNFNRDELGLAVASRLLRHFHAMLDRHLFGKRWAKQQNRTAFMSIPEIGKGGRLHHHLLLRLPSISGKKEQFAKGAPALFRRVTTSGTLDVIPVPSMAAQRIIAEYITKRNLLVDFIISDGFHSPHRAVV